MQEQMLGRRGKENNPSFQNPSRAGLEEAVRNYLTPPKPQEKGSLEERQTQENELKDKRRSLAEAFGWVVINEKSLSAISDVFKALLITVEEKRGSNPGI